MHFTVECATDKKRAFSKYHYLNHGKAEGRKYLETVPADFNPEMYLALNQDVMRHANTLSSVEEKRIFTNNHYLNHGFFEKRKYK